MSLGRSLRPGRLESPAGDLSSGGLRPSVDNRIVRWPALRVGDRPCRSLGVPLLVAGHHLGALDISSSVQGQNSMVWISPEVIRTSFLPTLTHWWSASRSYICSIYMPRSAGSEVKFSLSRTVIARTERSTRGRETRRSSTDCRETSNQACVSCMGLSSGCTEDRSRERFTSIVAHLRSPSRHIKYRLLRVRRNRSNTHSRLAARSSALPRAQLPWAPGVSARPQCSPSSPAHDPARSTRPSILPHAGLPSVCLLVPASP